MIYVNYFGEENGKAKVNMIYFKAPSNLENVVSISLDEPPKSEEKVGKNATLYVDIANKKLFYLYEDRGLTLEEKVKILEKQLKNGDQKYKELDISKENIYTVRDAKIEQLKYLCSQSIYAGFTSVSLGYKFGFNERDQDNFSQQTLLVLAGSTSPIQWKTKNNGVVTLTKEQFMTLIEECKTHKLTFQEKYWTLEDQVLNAQTVYEVDAVKWV
jgi:hypothetical protein